MTFQTLFQKTTTGAIQQWRIWTEANVIHTEYGQVDGKLQTTSDTIAEGKNPGKANETTPVQQAEKEAKARWTKKKKAGMVESLADAQAGKVDESVIKGGIEPMLAPSEIFPHYKKDLTFPVYTQPKLDGNRCIDFVADSALWTRTRKTIGSVPHIVAAAREAFGDRPLILDGELYNHEYRDHFEDLMSLIRPPGPVEGHEVVQYWIYDLPSNKGKFSERYAELVELFKQVDPAGPLKLVPTRLAKNEDEVFAHHEVNLGLEFEGTMVRNDGPYEEGKRSRHLQKLKTWKDAEYPIIGFADGRGKDAGTVAAFICRTPNGKEFRCRLKATYERRRELFQHPEQWQEFQLTVRYQNLTAEEVPRFPIGKGLRKTCE